MQIALSTTKTFARMSNTDKVINDLSGEKKDSCGFIHEQLHDYKKELSDVNLKLLSLDLSSSDELTLHSLKRNPVCLLPPNQGADNLLFRQLPPSLI